MPSMSALPDPEPQNSNAVASDNTSPKPNRRMSTGQRLLFFLTAWLICLMPFLFWWKTWIGRPLRDPELVEYLNDEKKPRHIQQALVQIGERIGKHDASVTRWYPELIRLSTHHVEELRNTDAWVMGQDTSGSGFHETLLKMLSDPFPTVRGNAALALVRFGDASGRTEIIRLLQPAVITAPQAGTITDTSVAGTVTHQNGVVAKLQSGGQTTEIRSPIGGRIRTLSVQTGKNVAAGNEIATVAPETDQVWEALRALYLIGQLDDLPAVTPYERESPDVPDHIRQQATETARAIQERSKQ